MEVTTKPRFNAPVFPDQLNKLFTLFLIGMIQPTTSIDNMILLQDSEPTPIWRSMRKDEDLPSLLRRMVDDKVLEPVDLRLVNGNFVGGVDCIAKDGRTESNKQGFVCNLAAELWSFFIVRAEVHFEVFLIRFKLVRMTETTQEEMR